MVYEITKNDYKYSFRLGITRLYTRCIASKIFKSNILLGYIVIEVNIFTDYIYLDHLERLKFAL